MRIDRDQRHASGSNLMELPSLFLAMRALFFGRPDPQCHRWKYGSSRAQSKCELTPE